ncbi:branched-chain amino acid transport system permease protein [Caldicellulosiruptor bescii]|uniref:Inner-membrane translocator n=2 Tax=Caldicellulosiruptor bescii TaxID=31899 RepID=B9MS32_CALBD|nr:branched-chain amino acid ABC transporter permease [Caldicellulosiruptor bescii]ACM60486.1 inner-membrane translocator [Caldicellulosiruptor bescii DSM 6725]PBC87899.1 branched-chain amino acid transport system permease protein [Caldicellulosiruptor bescii]PBC90831.1 branched-chain amino acid transport system permease protein [Caldicellulosiruptor bescii]PBD03737.1 branched-chain amino acid transport system permease protein [Caldicellulosiruptor bescii]PBD06629.1 branched-chain amino acid t
MKKRLLIYSVFIIVLYLIITLLMKIGIIDDYIKLNLFLIMLNIILAVSLNLINGITGQFSLGHAGFMAIGAYTTAVLTTLEKPVPFYLTVLIGGLFAMICGLIIGLPVLRLRGDYLAIATLGFGEIIRVIIQNIDYLGGASGISDIPQGIDWTGYFVITVLSVVVILNIINSSFGRAMIAIREDEIAAEAMGINTTLYKVLAFMIGAFFAGVAGSIYSGSFGFIQPDMFNFFKSIDILVIVVLGGLGSISGSIISAIVLTIISALLQDYPAVRMVLYSIILIIIMLFRPQGLMGTKEIRLSKLIPFGGEKNA